MIPLTICSILAFIILYACVVVGSNYERGDQ